jgi:hypothetical protein
MEVGQQVVEFGFGPRRQRRVVALRCDPPEELAPPHRATDHVGAHPAGDRRPAEAVPDLGPSILAKAHPPNAGRWEWIRTALAVVALTELVLSVPALFGVDAGASIHVARHVGSLSAALAVGLLYAAWKPVRAYGLLPIALALAGCLLVTSLVDLASGRVDALGETHHVLDLVAVTLLWALAGWPLPRLGGRTRVRALSR